MALPTVILVFRQWCGPLLDRKSTRLKLQSRPHLVCRLLLEKKKKQQAVEVLPVGCREAVALIDFEAVSFTEIADTAAMRVAQAISCMVCGLKCLPDSTTA